ncbi:MAG: translation initiation factor [Opitutus sp.]|nr:translation initiation factor [Opitutus sp.]
MNNQKISTDGGQGLGQNPFAALSGARLPSAPKVVLERAAASGSNSQGANVIGNASRLGATGSTTAIKNRGRVDIRRETGGRGGKTVTVIDGFVGIGLPEKEQLTKKMRAACGCGGTVKDGEILIQGDQRETIARILSDAGFRPVFAGG